MHVRLVTGACGIGSCDVGVVRGTPTIALGLEFTQSLIKHPLYLTRDPLVPSRQHMTNYVKLENPKKQICDPSHFRQ